MTTQREPEIVYLSDPLNSRALLNKIYLKNSKQKLSEAEEITYDLWSLSRSHRIKPWEVYPDINRARITKYFLTLDELLADRQRMDMAKLNQKKRKMTKTERRRSEKPKQYFPSLG